MISIGFQFGVKFYSKNQSKKTVFWFFFLGFVWILFGFVGFFCLECFFVIFWFFRFQLHFNCLFLIWFYYFFDFNQVDFLDFNWISIRFFLGFQLDFDFNWIFCMLVGEATSLKKENRKKKSNPIFFIFLTDTVLPPFDTYFSQNMQLSLAMFDYQGTSFSSNMWILNCQVCLPEGFHQWKWATAPNQACT